MATRVGGQAREMRSRPPVQRDDANFAIQLVEYRHVPGALDDLVIVVVPRPIDRRPVGETPLARIETQPGAVVAVSVRLSGTFLRLCPFRRERDPPIPRIPH